jgi:hypothetical protein
MEVDSEQEPCRAAVLVGAIPSGLQWARMPENSV